MRTKLSIILILFLSYGANAQEKIELFDLFSQAKQNHPLKKQADLYQKQSGLNQQALKKNYYPQLNLNGQMSYQSDVTEINIPVPGIALPEIAKDQYKLNLDASQLIYDGGINQSQQKLEELKSLAMKTGVDVELYKVYDQVSNMYFGILLIDENQKAIDESLKELNKRIEVAEAAVQNGVITRNNLDKLKASKLQLDAKQIELKYKRTGLLKSLSQLTGQEYSTEIRLDYPKENKTLPTGFARPEHQLFANQQALNREQIDLQQKTRLPKAYAFGQAGYGRPGYNMFTEDFDDYYMIGLKLSWNIYDWGQTRDRKDALAIEQDIINNKKEAFDLNLKIVQGNYLTELEKLDALMLNEAQIVQMQQEILERTSAELDNGTITSVDYLSDLNNFAQSNIRLNTLMVQKLQTQVSLLILSGEIEQSAEYSRQ
ncbi:MAG: TolC family protein [Bacteroidales bacterium]|nr:TolC family protein [Bacteroidales bacterium]MCF8455233.1 TolC family protein [Bacteroidales bacterium]